MSRLRSEQRGLRLLARFSWACARMSGADVVQRPCFVVQQRARDAPAGAGCPVQPKQGRASWAARRARERVHTITCRSHGRRSRPAHSPARDPPPLPAFRPLCWPFGQIPRRPTREGGPLAPASVLGRYPGRGARSATGSAIIFKLPGGRARRGSDATTSAARVAVP